MMTLLRLGYDPSDPGAFWGPVLGALTLIAEATALALKAWGLIALPWLYVALAVPGAWLVIWIGCIAVFCISLAAGRVSVR